MADEIRIDITAKDDASKKLDQVADRAEDLERLDPEVDVTADTATASADLSALAGKVDTLDADSATIDVTADTAKAESALSDLRSDLDQTGEKADETARKLDNVGGDGGGGLQTRGNAIADLTGPLGEASSAASDFAGVFDGLGDIAGDVAGKLGASQDVAAKVSGALGGLGIAVAAGAALWSLWSQNQKKAREEAEKMITTHRKLTDALEAGDAGKWADEFVTAYGDVIREANKAGFSTIEVTRAITGQDDALTNVDARLEAYAESLRLSGMSNEEAMQKAYDMYYAILTAQTGYEDLNGTIQQQDALLAGVKVSMPQVTTATKNAGSAADKASGQVDELTASQERSTREGTRMADALDRIQGALDMEQALADFSAAVDRYMWIAAEDTGATAQDVRDLKQSVIDAATAANMNPIILKSTLDAVDQGDLDRVRLNVENAYALNPVELATKLKTPTGGIRMGSGGGSESPQLASVATTVVMNVPRGYRGDLLADARRASRRSGRRYQRGGV